MIKKNFIQTKIISVAIIDSRPIFRKGLKVALEHIGGSLEVIEVENYQNLENWTLLPDIFFLGAGNLSDAEIINNSNYLRTMNKSGKIVMYDYRNSLDFILRFFPEKFNGYLAENFDDNDLVDCLTSLTTSNLYLDSEILYRLLVTKTNNVSGWTKLPHLIPLSSMENIVADYLIKGMSTSQIANQMKRAMSTISSVKANIYKKTKVGNIVELARILERK